MKPMKYATNKQTIDERIRLIKNHLIAQTIERINGNPTIKFDEVYREFDNDFKSLILDVVKEALSVNEGTWIGQMTLQNTKEILGMERKE